MKKLIILCLIGFGSFGQNAKADLIIKDFDNLNYYWSRKFQSKNLKWVKPSLDMYSFENPKYTKCGLMKEMNFVYCPAENKVLLSADFFKVVFDTYDYFVFTFCLAHEFGHSFQNQYKTNQLLTLERELQADCLAGTFLNWRVHEKDKIDPNVIHFFLNRITSSDEKAFKLIFGGNSHGNPQLREMAFNTGFESGNITECLNNYGITNFGK